MVADLLATSFVSSMISGVRCKRTSRKVTQDLATAPELAHHCGTRIRKSWRTISASTHRETEQSPLAQKDAVMARFAEGMIRVQRTTDLESRKWATMRTELLRFNGAVERDPAINAWMKEHAGELGALAHQWFEVMRKR